jgi:glycosyltransferase involved in cell wall biosynthesis
MKILWVCGSPIVGGAERVCIQVLELLKARSHAIAALVRNDTSLAPHIDHFADPVYRAQLGGSLDFLSINAIVHAVRDFSAEVILVTTPDEWVWACAIPQRVINVPLVLVRQMSLRLFAGVRWLADKRAHAVIAGSEAVKASLLGRAGIRMDLIHVIPNPVRFRVRDEVLTNDARAERRLKLGLPRGGRWIGFFGGNDPQKGIGDLLAAARQARNAGIDLNLLIGGRVDPKHGKPIADWISEFDLGSFVYHQPAVPDVEQAMSAMETIVVATRSRLGEGLPLTALEAMAGGIPVIGYSTAGIVEAIGASQEGGLLARADDPADLARAIVTLLSNADLASQIAHRGLTRARERFDPTRAADQYERVLISVTTSVEIHDRDDA